MFASFGVPIVDTDPIAREVVAPGTAGHAAVRAAFGAGILAADGGLDRVKLRDLVFEDSGARRRLEDILHPLIRAARSLASVNGAFARSSII